MKSVHWGLPEMCEKQDPAVNGCITKEGGVVPKAEVSKVPGLGQL